MGCVVVFCKNTTNSWYFTAHIGIINSIRGLIERSVNEKYLVKKNIFIVLILLISSYTSNNEELETIH